MQVACFIFIKRRWAEDKEHMENMLDYFCDIREPLQLLLFPEGTDLTGGTQTQDIWHLFQRQIALWLPARMRRSLVRGRDIASARPDLIHSY